MTFRDKLSRIIKKNDSLVCVGLDPEISKLPDKIKTSPDAFFEFNKAVIDATHDLVSSYKPNIAFYEGERDGLIQLRKTLVYLQTTYPEVPVVLDAKRGDIGNTARMYAKAAFEYWQVDAVTVYPHLGYDSLVPFLEYKDKLTILLIKTSNPDSGMFQNIETKGGKPYYLKLAETVSSWNKPNLGIFVGATYPEEMKQLRDIFPDHIFLTAGIGAQSASVEEIVKAGIDKDGAGIMFNASRSIIYASGGEDFAEKAKDAAQKLRDEINRYR